VAASDISESAAAWRSTLTSLQRAGWEGLAGTGSSGIDAYVKGNAVAMLAGMAREDDFPASASMSVTPITDDPQQDASAFTITVTIPADWDPGNARCAVFATAPQSVSRASQQFNFLFVGATDEGVSGAQAVPIPASHPAHSAAAGQVVYVRTVPFPVEGTPESGQAGQGQQFRTIVVA